MDPKQMRIENANCTVEDGWFCEQIDTSVEFGGKDRCVYAGCGNGALEKKLEECDVGTALMGPGEACSNCTCDCAVVNEKVIDGTLRTLC